MTSSNVSRTHEYIHAVALMGPFEDVAAFYDPQIVVQEFPNRIAPRGASGAAPTCGLRTSRDGRSCGHKITPCDGWLRLATRSPSSWSGPGFWPFP